MRTSRISRLTNLQLRRYASRALVLFCVLIELDTEVEAQVLELLLCVSAEAMCEPSIRAMPVEGSKDGGVACGERITNSLLAKSLPEGVLVDCDGRHGS